MEEKKRKILITGGDAFGNAKLKALLDKAGKDDSVEFVDMTNLPEGVEVTDFKKSIDSISLKEIEYQYQMIKDYDDFKYSHLTKKEREADIQPVRTEPKIGRNDPCPCKSGLKYKNCCITKTKANEKRN
jgi:uncharacterized protein YecA (UPF0149 family)